MYCQKKLLIIIVQMSKLGYREYQGDISKYKSCTFLRADCLVKYVQTPSHLSNTEKCYSYGLFSEGLKEVLRCSWGRYSNRITIVLGRKKKKKSSILIT